MNKEKTKLWIAGLGFGAALLTMLSAIVHAFLPLLAEKPVEVVMGTNAAGTNSPGTNAAADPKHAVPGNTGTVDYKALEKAPEGMFIDWHWVAVIVCLLVALLCILVWKRIRKRHREEMRAA